MWQEQLRIEHELTSRLNTLRETGIVVTQTETDELRKKLELIDRTKQVTSAGDSLMSSTQGRRGAFENQVAAMQRIGEEPVKGARQGDSATMLMQIAPDVLSGTQIQLDAQVAAFADMYNRIGILRDASLISDQTAGQARVLVSIQEAQMRLASTRDFFTNLATLSSSGNSRIAAIGKAAALTQATIDGVLAIQKALAAPPGWPYNAAGVIAVGIAQAANVAKIAGFEEGGYTGDYATGTVAGVVHGQEFVSNAASTRRNRPLLEALNSGADVGSSGASPRVNIVINTPAGTATTREERDTPDGKQIEFTIANAVVKQVRRGGIIAEALESQYGLNRATGTVR